MNRSDTPRNRADAAAPDDAESKPADAEKAAAPPDGRPVWERLRWPEREEGEKESGGPAENAQAAYEKTLSPLDRFAIRITERVGSFGFFLIIFAWTVLWCGYNILASEVKSLHWKPFDPFPAFVAYLLISNVIQIWLMPLIMVGQNQQARFSDIRAQMDFEISRIAEKEAAATIRHLEHQTNLLLLLLRHHNVQIPEDELRRLEAAIQREDELARTDPVARAPDEAKAVAEASATEAAKP